jgi:hypothetical protein
MVKRTFFNMVFTLKIIKTGIFTLKLMKSGKEFVNEGVYG